MSYEFHPLAGIFPLLEGAAFDALVADIAEHGLLEPVMLDGNKILDGRNRYRACKAAGVPCRFRLLSDTGALADPLKYVISLNVKRRHLSESQRAMAGAKLATMPQGSRTDLASIDARSDAEAAALMNVGEATIERAKAVRAHGIPELIAAVEQDMIAVSAAAKLAQWSDTDTQRRAVEKARAGIRLQEALRQIKAENVARRDPGPLDGRHRVFLADPPWGYGNTQPDYHPEQRDHYPVMSLDEICALPVRNIAEDDAVLFLWSTSPILAEAFRVIEAWGFTYKASFVWDKVRHNMGHYNSVRHEFLLVCVRGSCPPDNRTLFDSVVSIERAEHSRKPEIFHDIIETLYRYGSRIELFARRPRPGWTAWGQEAQADAA